LFRYDPIMSTIFLVQKPYRLHSKSSSLGPKCYGGNKWEGKYAALRQPLGYFTATPHSENLLNQFESEIVTPAIKSQHKTTTPLNWHRFQIEIKHEYILNCRARADRVSLGSESVLRDGAVDWY
jgi:hypothetical protein